jgi:hypothetical protein
VVDLALFSWGLNMIAIFGLGSVKSGFKRPTVLFFFLFLRQFCDVAGSGRAIYPTRCHVIKFAY